MLPLPEVARQACHAPIEIQVGVPAGEWDAYVASRPAATGYHLSSWAGVFTEAFGHQSRYLAARAGGAIVGILPLVLFRSRVLRRFGVSLPFLNYGGVVADSPEAGQALVDRAIEETRAAGGQFLELRHTSRLYPALPSKQHKVAMILGLEATEEAQWTALNKKIRNQVRKAEKSQLHASRGGLELLDPFYDVFARNMRDLGTPVYGRRWFGSILRTFPERTRILCVWRGSEPVAASFVFRHGDSLEVPWASSIRPLASLCGNTLLYWEMLRFAIETGCRRFDFGRSTPGAGTYDFKRQWGAEPHPLTWEYWLASGEAALPDMSPQNPRVQLAIDVWRRLPVAITRAVGPLIVRNIP